MCLERDAGGQGSSYGRIPVSQAIHSSDSPGLEHTSWIAAIARQATTNIAAGSYEHHTRLESRLKLGRGQSSDQHRERGQQLR